MEVQQQNALFQYFSDTLGAVIQEAKKNGRYDMGILGNFSLFYHSTTLSNPEAKLGQKAFVYCVKLFKAHSSMRVSWVIMVCLPWRLDLSTSLDQMLVTVFPSLSSIRSGLWWWEGEEGGLQEVPYTRLHHVRTCGTLHSMFIYTHTTSYDLPPLLQIWLDRSNVTWLCVCVSLHRWV